MSINFLNIIELCKYYRKVTPKILMQIVGSLYVFKIVLKIISNFLYVFSWQFMKSSMSWDMFGKILVLCL